MQPWMLSNMIQPNFDGGLMRAKYLQGGVRSVKTKAQRNNLGPGYRYLSVDETTMVFVEEDSSIYKLINNPVTATTTNGDWEKFVISGISTFAPVGTWDSDNTSPVLQDTDAIGRNGEFYFVVDTPTSTPVTHPGLFGGTTQNVVNGNMIVSVGDSWVVVANNVSWDSIAKPFVIDDYVAGNVIAHTHVAADITDLAALLAEKYDINDTADHTIAFNTVPDTAIIELEFLKQWYYTNEEIDTLLAGIFEGGVNSFLALSDSPNSYAGQALKFVRVNAAEDGLEFATGGGGGHIIENNGTPLTARANLNFKNGLLAVDNNPDTDVSVDLNYAFNWTALHTFGAGIRLTGGQTIDVVATGGSDVLNIGTANADIINIGFSGSTINIQGTLAYQNVTNLQVTDKLITLNKGGAAASGSSTGFEIEENNVITGFFATNGARNGFEFKAPSIASSAILSLSALTSSRTYTLPNTTGTIALVQTSDLAYWKVSGETSGVNATIIATSLDIAYDDTVIGSGVFQMGDFAGFTWTSFEGPGFTGDSTAITFANGNFTIASDINLFPGLTYNVDYSTNFTNRSLIDKGYADGAYMPIGSTFWKLTGTSDFTGSVVISNQVATVFQTALQFTHTLTTTAGGQTLRAFVINPTYDESGFAATDKISLQVTGKTYISDYTRVKTLTISDGSELDSGNETLLIQGSPGKEGINYKADGTFPNNTPFFVSPTSYRTDIRNSITIGSDQFIEGHTINQLSLTSTGSGNANFGLNQSVTFGVDNVTYSIFKIRGNTITTAGFTGNNLIGIDYDVPSIGGTIASHISLRLQNGSTLIGHTALGASTTRLQVRGYSNATGILTLLEDSAGTLRLSVLDNGTFRSVSNASNPFRFSTSTATEYLEFNPGAASNLTFSNSSGTATIGIQSGAANLIWMNKRLQAYELYISQNGATVDTNAPFVSRTGTTGTGTLVLSANAINAGTLGVEMRGTVTGLTTNTSTVAGFNSNTNFAVSSGNAELHILGFNHTINTTGSYAGILIGADYNPTVTSATGLTHIAWRNTTGSILVGHTSLGAGTTRMQIRGIGTTGGILVLLEDSAGAERFAILDNGRLLLGNATGTSAHTAIRNGTSSTNIIELRNSSDNARWSIADAGTITHSVVGGIQMTIGSVISETLGIGVSATNMHSIVANVTAASGTVDSSALRFSGTINTSGTHSGGTFVGINYDPTLTSITGLTHLAWRNTSGSILIGHTTLSAGTTRFQMRGFGTSTGVLALFEDSGGIAKMIQLDNGRFGINIASATLSASTAVFNVQAISGDANVTIFRDASVNDTLAVGTLAGQLNWSSNTAIYPSSNDGTVTRAGTMIVFASAGSVGQDASNFHFTGNGGTVTSGGERRLVRLSNASGGFAPTSGSTKFIGLSIGTTINQTGTANGDIIGVRYEPTLTSILGTHYAWLSTAGAMSWTSSSPNLNLITGTFTATANNDYHFRFSGSLTGTATNNNVLDYHNYNPTLIFGTYSSAINTRIRMINLTPAWNDTGVTGSGTSNGIGIRYAPTGAQTQTHTALMIETGKIILGSATPASSTNRMLDITSPSGTNLFRAIAVATTRFDITGGGNILSTHEIGVSGGIAAGSTIGYLLTQNSQGATSGSAAATAFSVVGTINNSGSFTGNYIGYHFNPTQTGMTGTTLISMMLETGHAVLGHNAVVSNNRLGLRGFGTTTGLTLLLEDSAGTDTFGFRDDGKLFHYIVPANDDALTQVLVRDPATGEIKYRDAASLGGGGGLTQQQIENLILDYV